MKTIATRNVRRANKKNILSHASQQHQQTPLQSPGENISYSKYWQIASWSTGVGGRGGGRKGGMEVRSIQGGEGKYKLSPHLLVSLSLSLSPKSREIPPKIRIIYIHTFSLSVSLSLSLWSNVMKFPHEVCTVQSSRRRCWGGWRWKRRYRLTLLSLMGTATLTHSS